MAIDTSVGEFEYPGEEEVGTPADATAPSGAARLWLQPNVLWAIAGGVVGYLIGHWLGNVIASGYTQVQDTGQNDVAIVLGLSLGVVGLDGRHRRASTTRWPRSSATSSRPRRPSRAGCATSA